MKNKIIYRTLLFLFSTCFFNAKGQLNEVDFLRGNFEDARTLFKEYLAPWANSLGAGLNSGWYNTARVHKPLGFDISISLSAAWSPVSAGTYDVSELDLEGILIGSSLAPTIAGDKTEDRPSLSYQVTDPVSGSPVTIAEYKVPDGTGVNYVPLPMAQLGIGLPFGTELTGRFLPGIDIGDAGNIGLWGVGLKHSISQWIPGIKHLSFLDISAQGGYTHLMTYANLNFNVDDAVINKTTNPLDFKNQKVKMSVEAYTLNLILSQTFAFITFYQGIGYSSSETGLGLKGNFPLSRLETDETSSDYGYIVVTDDDVYKDPIDINIQNTNDLRLNAGLKLKLGILTIHADYTKANYSAVTAGVGISFR